MLCQDPLDTSDGAQNQPNNIIAIAGYEELLGYSDAQFLIDKQLISDWKGVIMVAGLMGAGKTTFMQGLVGEIPGIILIQSQKTRLRRPGEVFLENVVPASDCVIITEKIEGALPPPREYRFYIPIDQTVVAEISVGVDAVREKFAHSCSLWLNTTFAEAMKQASERDGSAELFIDRIPDLGNYQTVSGKANISIPATLKIDLVIRIAIKKLAEFIRKQKSISGF